MQWSAIASVIPTAARHDLCRQGPTVPHPPERPAMVVRSRRTGRAGWRPIEGRGSPAAPKVPGFGLLRARSLRPVGRATEGPVHSAQGPKISARREKETRDPPPPVWAYTATPIGERVPRRDKPRAGMKRPPGKSPTDQRHEAGRDQPSHGP